MVLLLKDYVWFKLMGEYVGDMFDSVGMLWMDVVCCDWSELLLVVIGLSCENMLCLVEGLVFLGFFWVDLCVWWGFDSVLVVVGGGGDNVVLVCGVGVIELGMVFVLFGMLGVLFVIND